MSTVLPPQYEDPDGVTSIALFKARMPQANLPGSYVSGARILNFSRGWAHAVMAKSHRSHWFERCRTTDVATALCGQESDLHWIFGAGSYPRCSNCIRQMTRFVREGTWK